MAREMAATVLGAGGATATADPVAAPAADELEPGGAVAEAPDDSASGPIAVTNGLATSEAPDGTPAPDDKRLRDTQAALHKAKAEAKSLAAALEKLMPGAPAPPVAVQQTYAPTPPPAYAPAPTGLPLKQLPSGETVLDIPLPMTEQDFEAAFLANSNRELDDRTAFRRSFGGLFQTYHEQFLRKVVPQLQQVFSQGTARDLAVRSQRARQGNAVKTQIEGYWKSVAPTLPTRFIWNFAQEAAQAYPGRGPQAISQQAAYCLSRALDEFAGAAAAYRPDTEANRVQDALLRPGEGGGGRSARPGAAVTNMADQMRNAFRGLRGG